MEIQNRFGYQWNKYCSLTKEYEGQFLNWTSPMTASDWRGKVVLDAGCGMGRNSFWPLKWGAKKVVAFDYDKRSVEKSRQTLKDFPNAEVEFKSIYEIPWENEFDVAFSIGVVHHLELPRRAIEGIHQSLKENGKMILWVYSYEGNEWIVKWVDPIRKNITSKLPMGLVNLIAYLCSLPLFIVVKCIPTKSKYLTQISNFKFWHLHSIVLDQLHPGVAHYWKKDEVYKLVEGIGFEKVDVSSPPNNSGWILTAIK